MLINRIELENFRAFKGKNSIRFTTDDKKNVTVIMGDNGSGKTTLAQAFLWCLYGENDFKIKEILNLVTKNEMQPEEQAKVRVAIDLVHEGIEYNVARTQKHAKEHGGKIAAASPVLEVLRIENGQRTPYSAIDSEMAIKKMLPQELSQFFFFDGERIKGLSDELDKGKSKGFANAVRQLVGLTAMMNAMEHLKPTKATSVVGLYNKKIDECGGKKIKELGTEAEKLENDLEANNCRLEEISGLKVHYEKEIADQKNKIMKFSAAEGMQRQQDDLKQQSTEAKKLKDLASKDLLKSFNRAGPKFLGKQVVLDALTFVKELGGIDKGIPDVTGKSIEFLIKRKKCVCGTILKEGEAPYKNISEAAEFLPPKSIGVMINDFVSESKHCDEFTRGFYHEFTEKFRELRKIEGKIEALQAKIIDLDQHLQNLDEVALLKQNIMESEKTLHKLVQEEKELLVKKGEITNKLSSNNKERDGLIAVDKNNQTVNEYRRYAIAAYNELESVYQKKESETREKLEKAINKVFTDIYSDALFMEIDNKYNINVSLANANVDGTLVEHSTAQSYSIIFAFIAGIIKLVKENAQMNKHSDGELCFTEEDGYPLVMDAPLSAFDKKRIKNICNTLPQIARQIIFFIKDTDGDIAEENMDLVIGKKYFIDIDSSCTVARIMER